MTSTTTNKRLVVTGFGPFKEHHYNPSWDAAKALAGESGTVAHLLPVTFMSAAQFAGAHLRAAEASTLIFIHLGLAANREYLSFERRAENKRDDSPDGFQPLITGARDHRTTFVDIPALVDDYNSSAPPNLPQASKSEDCGTFVCNALFYHSLRACERARPRGITADALFIHIPPTDPDGAKRLGAYLAKVLTSLDSHR